MIFDKEDYKAYDADLWNAIAKEEERQQNNIELIASENVVSKAVMAAQGSILTNKYAEGYPGRRYYGGTDVVDVVESLAIERAKEIFGAKFANVQPHSGSQANCAAYMALIEPGDTVMVRYAAWLLLRDLRPNIMQNNHCKYLFRVPDEGVSSAQTF